MLVGGVRDVSAEAKARVKALYYIMQSMEGKLGGGEGIEGLYGSITRSGMQKVLDCLAASCHLTKESHIVDVGAGLGRPLLHALVSPGVASASGIEIDRIKCNKAAAFLKHTIQELSKRNSEKAMLLPKVQCSSIEKVGSLEPGTHAYSFWEGVPTEGKCAFGKLFAESRSMKSVAVVQRAIRKRDPAEEMEEMGFGSLTLVSSFPVSMSGSGRSFTAYVFNKRLSGSASGTAAPSVSEAVPLTPAIAEGRHANVGTPESKLQPHDQHQRPRPQDTRPAALPLAEAEGCIGTPSPQLAEQPTPSQNRRPVSSKAVAEQLKSPGLPQTPKSAGISGLPRRVPLRNILQAADVDSESAAQASSPMPEPPRRSSRLKSSQIRPPTSSSAAPGKAAKQSVQGKKKSPQKGVQKPRSPQKSLESLGFRTRRSTQPKKTQLFHKDKQMLQARGLADALPASPAP